MNTPIEISNLADYINQIDNITHSEKSYLYRGQENEVWRVTSSAYRRLLIGQTNAETGLSETHVDFERNTSEQLYHQTLAEPYYGGARDGK